ncbi:MAG: hypothetical protein CMO01_07040 [Thalassobius sp.]|nr:hypothetical protein [Thalassovita sp.]
MKLFNRMMVALDHTYFDREILRFANYMASMVNPEKIYFVHVDRDLEMPDYLNFEYSKNAAAVATPKDELLRGKIKEEVVKHYGNWDDKQMKVVIAEGRPLQELLHWTNVKKVDLILVGNKKISEGSGITGNKLAREANCSIVFIPENAHLPFENVLIPFDFSGNADQALKTGLLLKKAIGDITLTSLHVFDVPMFNNYNVSVNYRELVGDVHKYKVKAFKEYLGKEGLDHCNIKQVFLENTTGRTAKHINDFILNNNIDFTIVGAKGHSAWDAFLMGSVTEKLISLNTTNPIMVMRKKK